MSKEQKQAFLDGIVQRVTSRKLLVWITATGLMAWGGLESGRLGYYLWSLSRWSIRN